MVGVVVFPANPEKGYKYKKTPRKVLEMRDDDMLDFSKGNNATSEYFHYKGDYDKLDDKEIIGKAQEFIPHCNMSEPRKSAQGYVSGNKEWFIRVIKCEREWFKRYRQ